VFELTASGCPDMVWPVLTAPESTRRFLFGISLEATWAPGSPITGWYDGAPAMQGEVLFFECPNRLSYVLASGPDHPEVYVTWEVEACGSGSLVRLSVDECGHSDRAQVEASWQPVVTALQGLLAAGRSGGDGDGDGVPLVE
jgi:uncharacterized protein YndB with AHSA1/START domain